MNPLIKTILSTNAGAGLAILRIVTGLTLMSHGSQKLFGMFGGAGLNGMAQWFESIGLTPGYLLATLAGSAEFFGGLALVIGLLVRPASVVAGMGMQLGANVLEHRIVFLVLRRKRADTFGWPPFFVAARSTRFPPRRPRQGCTPEGSVIRRSALRRVLGVSVSVSAARPGASVPARPGASVPVR